MSEAPRRLDSLNRKPVIKTEDGAPAKPKFVPKAVARRSKEARDASAPAHKPEVKPPADQKKRLPGRGSSAPGARRGQGVASASSGAFSSVAAAQKGPRARSFSPVVTHSTGQARVKSESPMVETEEPGRIDMSSTAGSRVLEEERFFPVRLTRTLEQSTGAVAAAEDEKAEIETMLKDAELIRGILSDMDGGDSSKPLVMFQLPTVLPEFSPPDEAMEVDGDGPEGQIGELRFHASGKVTMTIGNIAMDVTIGTQSENLQEIVAVDPEKAHIAQLGWTQVRLVVSPDLTGTA